MEQAVVMHGGGRACMACVSGCRCSTDGGDAAGDAKNNCTHQQANNNLQGIASFALVRSDSRRVSGPYDSNKGGRE